MFKRFVSLFAPTEIPVDLLDKDAVKLYLRFAFVYSVMMAVLATLIMVGGGVLVWYGVSDAAHWSVSFLGLTISDAGPGTVLFFVGLLLVQITRFDRCVSPTGKPVGPNKDKSKDGSNSAWDRALDGVGKGS